MTHRFLAAKCRAVAVATVAVAACTVSLAAPASAGPAHPARKPHLHPGELLTARPLTTAAALPSAGHNYLVTYGSSDAAGKPIVVSGTISLPAGKAPRQGWPVVSWAHGTSGVADVCAPSQDTEDGLAHDYFSVIDPTLDTWVARGFAVVQTDYEGLGTPGDHPYLNGRSEANTVIDIVRAARELNRGVGRNWFVMGHSQGGQAAIFTAGLAARRAPSLRLLGAVPIAPGSGISQIADYIRTGNPAVAPGIPFYPLVVIGAAAADPSLNVNDYFTSTSRPLLATARTACLAQLRALTTSIPVNEVIPPTTDLTRLDADLAATEPATVTEQVPTLIAQGTADVTVPITATNALVSALCAKGTPITYDTYAGADHRGSVAASLSDVQQFVATRLAGKRPATTC
jgi:alpha-beta hydrolase superfamily lysophospholipase